jgi:hypothetical protein
MIYPPIELRIEARATADIFNDKRQGLLISHAQNHTRHL